MVDMTRLAKAELDKISQDWTSLGKTREDQISSANTRETREKREGRTREDWKVRDARRRDETQGKATNDERQETTGHHTR